MPVKNNGPGMTGRSSMTKKSKIEPEYPQWAESKMRAIENRRLKELQKVVRESMPEILAIVAEEQKTGSDSIRHDGYSDMVRRIQNRFRIMRDRLSRRLKTDPLERDVRRCADYTDRRQLKEWQRSVRATLGVDIHDDFFLGERYDLMLKRWVEQNVSFITSIESDCFDDMENVIIEGFAKGRTPAAISNEIQRRFDVTKSKAKEDGPAKADINTLLSMLDAANARADAAEDDTKPTEDEDDTSDDSSNQLNHDSAASIAAQVSQRVELCRLGDKLHLDGMESMPVMQAKKKVVHAVIPGMRLDGKSKAYINAAFDIAKGKINGRKTVADQRRQVFNADSANAAVRNVGKKNNPDEARDRMIQRHAGEKED